ncbi:Ttn [Symbiodinium sp. CCMP2456]|nr:Ttn [Symbiodinium sp. CCMP2456]
MTSLFLYAFALLDRLGHSSVWGFGPVHLNFGPPDLAVDGWEAAFGTLSNTPFLQLTSLQPIVFGFWGGDYASATHTSRDSTAEGTFSALPLDAYLCLMSVPVASYAVEVTVGDPSGETASCLKLEDGTVVYEASTATGDFGIGTAVVHKQAVDTCMTLRACAASAAVNTWKIEQILCHSSCAFCVGTLEGNCAVSCNQGRLLQSRATGTFCDARPPLAPSGLAAGEVTNCSLTLTWLANLSGGEPLIGYRVLATTGGAAYEELASTSSTASFIDLAGLAGDMVYELKVQALSAAGDGDLSEALVVRTGPIRPNAPPSPEVVGIGQYEVSMNLTVPDYDGGDLVVAYIVRAYVQPAGSLAKVMQSSHTQVAVDGLLGWTSYAFTVSAVNSVGASKESNLSAAVRTLQVPPGEPWQLNVTLVEQYAVELEWTAPLFDGGESIAGYQVSCAEVVSGAYEVLVDTRVNHTTVRIEGLRGWTLYECRVAARNSVGLGQASAEKEVQTLPVPPYAPPAPTVEEVLLTSAGIAWEPPEGETGAELIGYKVYVRRDDEDTFEIVSNDTGSTNTTWLAFGLDMYQGYYFAVAGFNRIGEGKLSNSSEEAFTAAPGLPHPPEAPRLNATHSTIEATWARPNDGGSPLLGYAIELAAPGAPFTEVLNVTDRMALLTGLLGNTSYEVRVRAIGTGGISYPGEGATVVTEPPVVPDEPQELIVNVDVPYMADLSWIAPEDDGGRAIEAYEVFLGGGSETLQLRSVQEPSAYRATGLLGSASYEFRVQAKNEIGRSLAATTFFTTPQPIAPAEPGAISVLSLGQDSASIAWEAPANDGGSRLIAYEVWSSADSADWQLEVVLAPTGLGANLTDLVGDTLYRFRVQAANEVGSGPAATSEFVSTLPVPPFPPKNVTCENIAQHQQLVSWLAPVKEGGFPVTGYRIWQRVGTAEELEVAVNDTGSNDTEFPVTELSGNTAYSYVVAGISWLGVGSWSLESDSVLTLPVAPSTPELVAGTVFASRLLVRWSAPEDGGSEITFYTAEVSEDGMSFSLAANVTTTDAEIKHLLANTTYYVRIVAWNDLGRSLPSSAAYSTSQPVPPSPPQDVAVGQAFAWRVELSWRGPEDSGGRPVESYQVTASSPLGFAFTAETADLSLWISPLLGDTDYNVSVLACNEVGCSQGAHVTGGHGLKGFRF